MIWSYIFDKSELAKAFGGTSADLSSGNEIMFSLSAESEADVQEWIRMARQAGGTIFREAAYDEYGFFYGGFADPDGHKFNVLLIEPGM
ncbi:VOC family protein [Pedobacter yulinensis]|uniref:VOC family protein n=1 Tax=Pedobacter yulinensis TaxID=2126353 RepID=UPI0019550294|nr:VOC family protein [Pedobacter yulinensis]